MRYSTLLYGSIAFLVSSGAFSHGLMSDPASRNWLCGAVTKPDQAQPGSACAQAFAEDFNGGYQFMSVLSHDVGRKGVEPIPENVCGFDSETWSGSATPWDIPIDWPTNSISSGEKTITWDISWGPHFDDTEEFRYWITKPDFEYTIGQALSWNDFEDEAFCVLNYDDSNPEANPNVVPDKGNALFHTTCDIPERDGRHVIYGEWGRNHYTFERFHGCIDVAFDGGVGPIAVEADIQATPDVTTITGAGQVSLSAAGSSGENLNYQWSLTPANNSAYSLSEVAGEQTVLNLADTQSEQAVTVTLEVSNEVSDSTTSIIINHLPEAASNWDSLGALTEVAQAYPAGTEVQLRLVSDTGEDIYLPQNSLTLSAQTGAADVWPQQLADAVNALNTDVQIGVIDSNGEVSSVASATENRVYAQSPSQYASAFVVVDEPSSSSSSSSSSSIPSGSYCDWYGTPTPLCEQTQEGWGYENNTSCVAVSTCQSQPAPHGVVGEASSSSMSSSSDSSSSASSTSSTGDASLACDYTVNNAWNTGFTAEITLTNNSDEAVSGWSVNWQYTGDVGISNSWSADVSGTNPYQASATGHNQTINPGESVSFGFQASGESETVIVEGEQCQ
ncbi:lytic polysaccharide monooxygenase [Gilvimarinus sp. 1_MG-2023]|uniref:lytic polysaccharide monooxygenase n=1 Tax=Gilvimarinus sp. 1_MG-2023 TaxID=3062638 RepID=UPI0026E23C1C|nr:lytic polysaccharide monooxygenase [Gilvimarinus sp. 1_MG-2023]MDO6747025.1 lytic polysaccharide monooxygenase [Gilvimarinus sp. 1_MG-2023]